jgi:hypothetical protein
MYEPWPLWPRPYFFITLLFDISGQRMKNALSDKGLDKNSKRLTSSQKRMI